MVRALLRDRYYMMDLQALAVRNWHLKLVEMNGGDAAVLTREAVAD